MIRKIFLLHLCFKISQMNKILVILLVAMLFAFACNKDESNEKASSKPLVVKMLADKDTIEFGGTDPCTIYCKATGGNLKYTWSVDLGNIVPMPCDSGSLVRFTGSECCIGDKYIKCKISNELGSVDTTQHVFIRIPEK